MAALSATRSLSHTPGRRSFLFSFLGFGLAPKSRKSEKNAEPIFRFLTPECEIRMSVEYFSGSSAGSFRFRDSITNRAFCLSPDGAENQSCLQKFNGSFAIAHYHFRSRPPAGPPLRMRERVHTIDQDSRMTPRRPFERALAVEREMASDIQAFGYDPNDPEQAASAKSVALWALLRQDLFLNDQSAAFLTVHWKHTVDSISLVDLIPGDTTQLVAEGLSQRTSR
ncbi:MAG TPA: hypothetical protein VIH74_07165 [Candidatus Acidoferrum sp.]